VRTGLCTILGEQRKEDERLNVSNGGVEPSDSVIKVQ
jgi:hypothetical protein